MKSEVRNFCQEAYFSEENFSHVHKIQFYLLQCHQCTCPNAIFYSVSLSNQKQQEKSQVICTAFVIVQLVQNPTKVSKIKMIPKQDILDLEDLEWKYQKFSVTQILREINYGESRSSKSSKTVLFFSILGALNFIDLVIFSN